MRCRLGVGQECAFVHHSGEAGIVAEQSEDAWDPHPPPSWALGPIGPGKGFERPFSGPIWWERVLMNLVRIVSSFVRWSLQLAPLIWYGGQGRSHLSAYT